MMEAQSSMKRWQVSLQWFMMIIMILCVAMQHGDAASVGRANTDGRCVVIESADGVLVSSFGSWAGVEFAARYVAPFCGSKTTEKVELYMRISPPSSSEAAASSSASSSSSPDSTLRPEDGWQHAHAEDAGTGELGLNGLGLLRFHTEKAHNDDRLFSSEVCWSRAMPCAVLCERRSLGTADGTCGSSISSAWVAFLWLATALACAAFLLYHGCVRTEHKASNGAEVVVVEGLTSNTLAAAAEVGGGDARNSTSRAPSVPIGPISPAPRLVLPSSDDADDGDPGTSPAPRANVSTRLVYSSEERADGGDEEDVSSEGSVASATAREEVLEAAALYTAEYQARMRATTMDPHTRSASGGGASLGRRNSSEEPRTAPPPPFVGFSLAQVDLREWLAPREGVRHSQSDDGRLLGGGGPPQPALVVDGLFRGGPADQTGIRIGDVLLQVGPTRISTLAEARSAIHRHCRCGRIARMQLSRPQPPTSSRASRSLTTFTSSSSSSYRVALWIMTADRAYSGQPFFFDLREAEMEEGPGAKNVLLGPELLETPAKERDDEEDERSGRTEE